MGKGRTGKSGKNKVTISKNQEAQLMAQYLPFKARLDLIEHEIREREKPAKPDHPKKK